MNQNKTKVKTTNKKIEFKRKFSIWDMYDSFVVMPKAVSIMSKNKKRKIIDPHFIERLQLAVTEVNGCAACSYQHTKMALSQGMSNEEISSFLWWKDDFIKPEEAKAIIFAQHFADLKWYPDKIAYDAIVQEYGKEQAKIILSASQIMIAGNMYGIPFSAFQSRLKKNPYKDSTLFYELGMLIAGIILLPIGLIHWILRSLFGISNERFKKD